MKTTSVGALADCGCGGAAKGMAPELAPGVLAVSRARMNAITNVAMERGVACEGRAATMNGSPAQSCSTTIGRRRIYRRVVPVRNPQLWLGRGPTFAFTRRA